MSVCLKKCSACANKPHILIELLSAETRTPTAEAVQKLKLYDLKQKKYVVRFFYDMTYFLMDEYLVH